jgi:hypothetical protein
MGMEDPESSAGGLSIAILNTPAEGAFLYQLAVPAGGTADLTAFDPTGRVVATIRDAAEGQGILDLTGAPAGMYLVRAERGCECASARLVRL